MDGASGDQRQRRAAGRRPTCRRLGGSTGSGSAGPVRRHPPNAEWLSKLTFKEVIEPGSRFTAQQFLARESFALRYENGDPIWLHELLYALMQGCDAVVLQADVQVDGTEQLFNLLVGRRLQEAFGPPPQVCLTLPILVGTDGRRRMGQSKGDFIGRGSFP